MIDNQFRPTPASRLLPPCSTRSRRPGKPAVLACANGKVFPMSESDIEQKIGRDNLARLDRLGIPFHQNEPRNAEAYSYVGVSSRGTPVWLLDRGRRVRPEDHDRPRAGEPLGRGRRRQAHPSRRRLGRDDRVEPLRLRALAADALRRLRRPDALGHRRGRDDVRPPVHDERPPRHARPRGRLHLRRASRTRTGTAIERFNEIYAYEHPGDAGRHRRLRRLRPDRPPVLPHGLGLHVRGLRRSATAAR